MVDIILTLVEGEVENFRSWGILFKSISLLTETTRGYLQVVLVHAFKNTYIFSKERYKTEGLDLAYVPARFERVKTWFGRKKSEFLGWTPFLRFHYSLHKLFTALIIAGVD